MSLEHSDYPHWPGQLYDCPGCEAECFCDVDLLCIHCVRVMLVAGNDDSKGEQNG